jgi:hypothetical protein
MVSSREGGAVKTACVLNSVKIGTTSVSYGRRPLLVAEQRCSFLPFLEKLLHSADSGFLCQHVARDQCQGFFRTPLDALWFALVFAQVAYVDCFGFGVEHHRAVVAGFDAPAAAVTFVFVNHDCSGFFRLC